MYDTAFYYSRKLRPKESIAILQQMKKIKSVRTDTKLLAKVYGLMNNEYTYGLGDLATGLKYNLETLKLYQEMKEDIRVKSYISHAYLSMGNLKDAVTLYHELENIYHQKNLTKKEVNHQSYLMATQAELYIVLKKPDEVIRVNHRLLSWLDKFESKGDWDFMEIKRGGALLNMAVAYMQKEVTDSVRYYFSLSNKILGKPVYEDIRSTQIYIHQFNLLMYLKDYAGAEKINEHYANKLDENNKNRNILLMENTAKLYAKKGNFADALTLKNKLKNLQDSVYRKDTEQKTISNTFLKIHNNVQKDFFKTSQRKDTIYMIVILLTVLLLLFALFVLYKYYLNRNLKRVTTLISKQKGHIKYYTTSINALKKADKDEIAMRKLFERTENELQKNMAFLNPDFCREYLSSLLGTNRQYLIDAIQKNTKMSFNEYVKQKRIHFAHQLMSEQPHLNIEEIAKNSGYKNPKTFHKHFLEIYNKTPLTYQRELS